MEWFEAENQAFFIEIDSLKLEVIEVQLLFYECDICSIIEIHFLKRNIMSVFFFFFFFVM